MPDLETSLAYCTYCPSLCRHACPVSNASAKETFVPRHKMIALSRLHRGAVDASEVSTASLFACTGCGACTETCLHDVAPAAALFAGRAEAARHGAVHPGLEDLPERVRGHAERAALAMRESLPARRFPSEAQVALLPACEDPGLAATAVTLFDRLGAGYVAVADVTLACGGYPLLAGGQPDAFRRHAEELSRQLQGYTRVVVACPACALTMKNDYPAHGVRLRPEIVHLAEFAAQLAETARVDEKLPPAFYHDPCYLGRLGGVYEPPRRALARAVTEVREFSRCRGGSACSGGGGLLPWTMPEVADAIAEERLAEVKEAGITRVVTACAACKQRLGRSGVEALDLVEVLELATRPTPVT